jgi:hypothetical protein
LDISCREFKTALSVDFNAFHLLQGYTWPCCKKSEGVVSAEKSSFWAKKAFLPGLIRFLIARTFLEEHIFFIGLDDSTRVWLKNVAAT